MDAVINPLLNEGADIKNRIKLIVNIKKKVVIKTMEIFLSILIKKEIPKKVIIPSNPMFTKKRCNKKVNKYKLLFVKISFKIISITKNEVKKIKNMYDIFSIRICM